MRVKRENADGEPTFQIANKCLMLVKGPVVPTASDISLKLEVSLLWKYQTSLHHFLKNITMVTDRATVMARVANASLIAELHSPDETWAAFIAHFLNIFTKHSIAVK